jgi:uncharacterized membrane protein
VEFSETVLTIFQALNMHPGNIAFAVLFVVTATQMLKERATTKVITIKGNEFNWVIWFTLVLSVVVGALAQYLGDAQSKLETLLLSGLIVFFFASGGYDLVMAFAERMTKNQ